MEAILDRRRKDGMVDYTAQIKIKREDRVVFPRSKSLTERRPPKHGSNKLAKPEDAPEQASKRREVRTKGSLLPKRQGARRGRPANLLHIPFLVGGVQAEPDIALRELSEALSGAYGVAVKQPSIHRALARAELSKIKGLSAQECGRTDPRHAWHGWLARRQSRLRVELHHLVFIDETAVKANMIRLRRRNSRSTQRQACVSTS